MKRIIGVLVFLVAALSASASASFFPPYDQFVQALQLAPDAVNGGCVTVSSSHGGPFLVHANVTCATAAGTTFPNLTVGTASVNNPSAILIQGQSSAGAKLGSDSTASCAGVNGIAFVLTDNAGTAITDNAVGDIGFCGAAHFMNGATGMNLGPIAATHQADSTPVAASFHCVSTPQAGLTAAGASTSVVFDSLAAQFSGFYTLMLNDNGPTGFSIPAITAKTTTGFTFTSTNFATDTYSYYACGE